MSEAVSVAWSIGERSAGQWPSIAAPSKSGNFRAFVLL